MTRPPPSGPFSESPAWWRAPRPALCAWGSESARPPVGERSGPQLPPGSSRGEWVSDSGRSRFSLAPRPCSRGGGGSKAAAAAASTLSLGLRSAAASVEVLPSTTHDVADQSRRAVCLSGHGCAFHSVDDRLLAQERFRFLRRLSGAPGREPGFTARLILRPCDPLPWEPSCT